MIGPTKKVLLDVVESSNSILEWCDKKSFKDYSVDRQFRRSVEREFEIIGEALNRVRRKDPEIAKRIEDISIIVAFRNRVIHDYDLIDDALVWGIIHTDLPQLRDTVLDLLREEGEEI